MLAGCLAGLAGLAGWPGRAGLAGWLAWQELAGLAGLAGWTARKFTHGPTDGFTTVSPTLRVWMEGYTTTYAGALNTNY